MNFDAWNESPAATSPMRVTVTQAFDRGAGPLVHLAVGFGTSCEPLTTFPSVRVCEDHELVQVLTELPGVDADELEISVDGTTLTLQGRRKETSGVFRVDRCLEKFLCRIELPSAVDHARGEACLDMGVLSLTLPKLVCGPASTVKQDG